MINAFPWTLLGLALVSLALAGTLAALWLTGRDLDKAHAELQRLLQRQRIDQADINQARTAYHRVVGERDRARATVQSLLDSQRRWNDLTRPGPLPMPADVDDADDLTDEFTQITGRHTWPKWPDKPGQPS